MKKLLALFNPDVDQNIRLLTLATSIRWFGWGFVEAFIPVFLFTFSGTYAETGLLKSVYGITFLISLPIVSWFADRISSKKLMIGALLVYPLLSVSYFAAGTWGIVAFVVLSRILNGVGYALDSTGRSTYIRTHAPKGKVGTSFGYLDAIANFWWLIAVFISILVVSFVPVPYLFLPIAPTAIIALLLLLKLPNGKPEHAPVSERTTLFGFYSTFFKVIAGWSKKVRCLALLAFVVEIVSTMGEFFIPIYAFTQNESLGNVMLLTAFATLPTLLSAPLGALADKYRKTIFAACSCTAVMLIGLATIASFPVQLLLVLIISICLQLLHLAVEREVTFHVSKKEIGTLSGAFQGVSQLAEIMGPILMGIAIDLFDLPIVLIGLAVFCFSLGTFCHYKKIV